MLHEEHSLLLLSILRCHGVGAGTQRQGIRAEKDEEDLPAERWVLKGEQASDMKKVCVLGSEGISG